MLFACLQVIAQPAANDSGHTYVLVDQPTDGGVYLMISQQSGSNFAVSGTAMPDGEGLVPVEVGVAGDYVVSGVNDSVLWQFNGSSESGYTVRNAESGEYLAKLSNTLKTSAATQHRWEHIIHTNDDSSIGDEPVMHNVTTGVGYILYRVNGDETYFDCFNAYQQCNIRLYERRDMTGFVPTTGVSIGIDALELDLGSTHTFQPQVFPSNATIQNVTYTSSDSSVARINPDGTLITGSEGTAQITVYDGTGEFSDTCTVTVKVTNTGSVAGKDVVEVYAQSPYTDYDKANKVEKAAVELVGYAKTSELAPGASETVTVTFDQEQLKSYDYTNAKTYILDAGDYYITAAKNAHEAVNNILSAKGKTVADGMTADGDTAFVATYTPANGTVDTTTYKLDTTTGVEITNQLDHANGGFQYLSRNDWTGTWPTTDGEVSDQISTWGNPINGTDVGGKAASYTYRKTISKEDLAKLDSFDSLNPTDFSALTDEIVYGKDNGLGLIDMRGLDYDDEKWDELLDQLTPSDYQTLITQSGYGTAAIKSVDKPSTTDRDAATGLVNYGVDASGNFYFKGNITHCGVIVLAQTYNDDLATHYGENIGDESYYLDVDGWYAPAVNMHRTAFSGRNSEYYSEDPFIGGHIASLECEGVASRGMYVFVKHYAINDQEDHRGDREGQYSIATFLNEQAAREIYLKPFEMCVKSDKVEMNYAKDNGDGTYSNATTEIPSVTGIMTSFNRVGYTWAGGNYNMITGLLRNEWGFHGFIITDNANTGVFMDAGQMIQAGADGKLTNLPTGARYTFNKNDVSDYHYGREAVHNILYTIANSKAMNGGMPGSRYLAKVEPYQKVIYAVDGVCGGLIAVLVILTIFRFRKKKEDNIKTV